MTNGDIADFLARAIGEMLIALMADATHTRPARASQSSLQSVNKAAEVFAEA